MHLKEVSKLSISDRIKYIRDDLEMSRAAFGETLGVSGDVINNLERGRVKIQESMLRLICKTHHVSYLFLTEGFGDPYVGVPGIIMNDAVEKYNLDETDKSLIEEYVKLDEDTRKAFKQYLLRVFEKASD